MKTLFALTVLGLLVFSEVDAQTTKISIYNATGAKLLRLQPAAPNSKTITIRPYHWAVIQINADSLGFLFQNQPYFLHFERVKSYYYIAQSEYVFVLKETSQREFHLTILANKADSPDEYSLPN
ncbi:hypothetical protein [Spirosoma sp. KNUC1025]|uniref:hypothetical protein n=1 Tax=Spirosoma sp. KNUC1025 TaxID=2894082 RepID=UPI00386B26E6|nr:hypothetical protein LN737_08385 [Spirosoma sp. KNUC1025]